MSHLGMQASSMMELPTLFETAASERVMPSLLAALDHAITVIATRHPYRPVLLLHAYREEAIALALLLVERQCLEASDGTMAEVLFGMRRAMHGKEKSLLDGQQRQTALLLHVGVAYAARKLERMCAPEIEAGDELVNEGEDDAQVQAGPSFDIPSEPRQWAIMPTFGLAEPGSRTAPPGSAQSYFRQAVRRYYPWVHAAKESAALMLQILYLFDRTPYCSPWLWLAGQTLRRLTGMEMMQLEARSEEARAAQVAFVRARWGPLRFLLTLLLRGWHLLNDKFKIIVLGAALVIKLADWWFSSRSNAAESNSGSLPVPPPPERQAVSAEGLQVPSSGEVCAICSRLRTNPTAASSGYVFCYPCIYRQVERDGKCPVTLLPCTVEQLRRVYEST